LVLCSEHVSLSDAAARPDWPARGPGSDNFFSKTWNRVSVNFSFCETPIDAPAALKEARQTRKIAIPNFFACNALISHISAKNKFAKICKAKVPAIENKRIFCGSDAPNLAKPRHPRVLQGFAQDQCRSPIKRPNRLGKLVRASRFPRGKEVPASRAGKKTAPPGALESPVPRNRIVP
jgi:hypothetical protein